MVEELIVSRGLWKRFGSTVALRDINLIINGGLHLILGPNGSGKSTFLKLSCGLIKPTGGSIYTLGLNPWRNRVKIIKRVGVAFEDIALPDWLSGRDFLRYVVERRRSDWSLMLEMAREFGVTSYWDKMIRGYSSGMRKKIILLSALGWRPEILILDEPYTLLDRKSIEVLNGILKRTIGEIGLVLVASHIFSGLESYVNSLTILFDGEVILHGSIDDKSLDRYRVYICRTKDPVTLLMKLHESGVSEVWLRGENIYFRGRVPHDIQDYAEISTILDVKLLYEDMIIGARERT